MAEKTSKVPGIKLDIITNDFHWFVSIGSLLLVFLGASMAWYKFKKDYAEQGTNPITKLSLNNWYLDKLYTKALITPFFRFSRLIRNVERRIIDGAVNLFGWVNVILSFMISWIDRAIVDGFVNISVFFAGRLGGITRSFSVGKVQSFIVLAIFSVLLMIFLIL